MSYTQTVTLQDNEQLAKVNTETGEIVELRKRKGALQEGMIRHRFERFHICNDKAMDLLWTLVTPEEFAIVGRMSALSDYRTNNLKPLSDETSMRELEKVFNINKGRVGPMLQRLFSLGVYASIKVVNGEPKEYWVLNPYISWRGNTVDEALLSHFDKTIFNSLR